MRLSLGCKAAALQIRRNKPMGKKNIWFKKKQQRPSVKKIPWPGVTTRRHHIFILPVDSIWSWWSCIYLELKDVFEANEQGVDGESRNSKTLQFQRIWRICGVGNFDKIINWLCEKCSLPSYKWYTLLSPEGFVILLQNRLLFYANIVQSRVPNATRISGSKPLKHGFVKRILVFKR